MYTSNSVGCLGNIRETVMASVDVSLHTRSLTLIECLRRLEECKYACHPSVQTEPTAFTIHVVGADHREGNAGQQTCAMFALLIDHFLENTTYQTLNLVFVGPNVARKLHQSTYSQQKALAEDTDGKVRSLEVKLFYYVGSFDDFYLEKDVYQQPDLAVCFNAGLWGYDEWIPTIKLLAHSVQVPLLVTCYNGSEAEDDEDIVESIAPARWFWRAEKNPFGSLNERSTNNEYGSILRENDHWICIGPAEDSPSS